ncbi:TPA: S-layer protein SlpA [Clostridioides difficile]
MNKKSLAMAMAAVTVVGSAAPVFAANADEYTVVQKDYKNAVKKLQEGITTGVISQVVVYFDNNEIKTIKQSSAASTSAAKKADREKMATDLYNLVDKQLDGLGDGDTVKFSVTYDEKEKTYTEAELNKIVENLENKLVYSPATETKAGVIEDDGSAVSATTKSIYAKDLFNFVVEEDDTNGGYKLTLKDNTSSIASKYKYATNTGVSTGAGTAFTVDVTNVLEKGKVLDAKNSCVPDTTLASKANGLAIDNAQGSSGVADVTVINAKSVNIDIDANSSDSAETLAKKYVFNPQDIIDAYDNIKVVDNKYQVVLYPEGKRIDTKGAVNVNTPAKVILKSEKEKDLRDYLDDLKSYNNSYSNSVVVAGEDRISTAIELSSKYYNSDDSNALFEGAVDNVVLVGSQSIVDGLVASPLASEKKAPLLLTSKDKLDTSVKAELKRVMDLKSTQGVNTSKKVYLAGGVNSISKEVENELKDMGLKVTRLAGDDRYETSLEIADEIGLDNNKAFVVGGQGLADAMSIAPVASQLKDSSGDIDVKDGDATPIVVVDNNAKTINSATQDFLDNAQVDIIGGEKSVSKDIENSIEDYTGKDPERVKGEDRQGTNAEVIKNTDYFKKASVDNFFVAKDGSTKEDQLVDALAAAAVAANFGSTYDDNGKLLTSKTVSPAPIVLATDSLSSDQNVAVSKSVADDGATNLVQVGQGIANSVITKLKDLLDM